MSELPLFSQPGQPKRKPAEVRPMTPLGQEMAARLKEIFYAYGNRNTEDNRSAQQTLGPSEIGTPCDRRLAMSLLGMRAVNPGGDGWAAFVGTSVHAGLAEIFQWADGGTGRFAVEQKLTYPNDYVPHGTGDLLDRTALLFGDHKLMGASSRSSLKKDGPKEAYRVQVHTYGYGAVLRGEVIEHVAIIAWPRDLSSLDQLYVWTEPYDQRVAEDALGRVKGIARTVEFYHQGQGREATEVASRFPFADDCKFCPFHLPNARDLRSGGCNGKA